MFSDRCQMVEQVDTLNKSQKMYVLIGEVTGKQNADMTTCIDMVIEYSIIRRYTNVVYYYYYYNTVMVQEKADLG